jgi:hypothetical protein
MGKTLKKRKKTSRKIRVGISFRKTVLERLDYFVFCYDCAFSPKFPRAAFRLQINHIHFSYK